MFDSSAECDGTSLNDVLLSGPDLNNTLLGVLLQFQREPVALTADVQQMFYCFVIREDHRDYLWYLWYEDNDITKNVVEYRMKVHVFGNSPSPAVAIYCMRRAVAIYCMRAAQKGEQEHGSDARQFVERQFYVDDGLTSVTIPEEAIDLLTRTREMLSESNLRLHKVASNSKPSNGSLPSRGPCHGSEGSGPWSGSSPSSEEPGALLEKYQSPSWAHSTLSDVQAGV